MRFLWQIQYSLLTQQLHLLFYYSCSVVQRSQDVYSSWHIVVKHKKYITIFLLYPFCCSELISVLPSNLSSFLFMSYILNIDSFSIWSLIPTLLRFWKGQSAAPTQTTFPLAWLQTMADTKKYQNYKNKSLKAAHPAEKLRVQLFLGGRGISSCSHAASYPAMYAGFLQNMCPSMRT